MGATREERGRDKIIKKIRKRTSVSVDWDPKTKLGRMVRKGEITNYE